MVSAIPTRSRSPISAFGWRPKQLGLPADRAAADRAQRAVAAVAVVRHPTPVDRTRSRGQRMAAEGEVMGTLQFRTVDSPVGLLTLAGKDGRLMHLRMVDQTYEPSHDGWEPDDEAFPDAVDQLEAYFAGERTEFDLELDLVGTAFQRRVWEALLTIPYGETRSYGEIAAQIGSPGAFRAVGLANGHNPIGIIVPCHRVIGSNGSLTGYGGGLDRKRALLELEKSRSSRRCRLIRLNRHAIKMPLPPNRNWGAQGLMCVRRCPTFPPGLGSIIGAGRLSFRVRDGSGRFPAAIDRRNFIHSF